MSALGRACWLGLLVAWSAAAGASGSTAAIDPGQPPKGWIEVAAPATAAAWQCANQSSPDRTVAGAEAAPLRIGVLAPEARADLALQLADGKLTASDHGEWGGRIEWLRKGAPKPTLIAEANSIALLPRGNEVYVASGLAHLSMDSGKLLRLRRAGDDWAATEVLDLGSAPTAAYRVNQDLVMLVGGKGLSLVDLASLTVKPLHRNAGWGYVYPNSLRPFGNAVAIGARGAVIVLRPQAGGYAERWWVPAKPGRCRPG